MIQKSTGYITGVDHLGSGLSYFLNKTAAQRFIQDNTTLYTNGYPGELISDGSAIGKKHAHWIRMNYALTHWLMTLLPQLIIFIFFYSYLDSFGWRLQVSFKDFVMMVFFNS